MGRAEHDWGPNHWTCRGKGSCGRWNWSSAARCWGCNKLRQDAGPPHGGSAPPHGAWADHVGHGQWWTQGLNAKGKTPKCPGPGTSRAQAGPQPQRRGSDRDHEDPNGDDDDCAAQPPAWVPQRNLQRKLDRMLRKRTALDDDLRSLDDAAQSLRVQIAALDADTQAVRDDLAAAVARAASEIPARCAPVAELEGLPASVRDLPAVQAVLAEAASAIRRIASAADCCDDGYDDYMDMGTRSPAAEYMDMRTPEGRAATRAASQNGSDMRAAGAPVRTPVPTPPRTEAPATPPGRWTRGIPRVGPLPGGPSGRHGTSPFADYAARRGRDRRSRSRSRSESPEDGPYARARPQRREPGQPTLEEWWTGQCG